MTNSRRPWHQRLLRNVTHHVPLKTVMTPSPLSLMSAMMLLGSLIALLSGIFAAALVLATASAGCMARLFRQSTSHRNSEPAS